MYAGLKVKNYRAIEILEVHDLGHFNLFVS